MRSVDGVTGLEITIVFNPFSKHLPWLSWVNLVGEVLDERRVTNSQIGPARFTAPGYKLLDACCLASIAMGIDCFKSLVVVIFWIQMQNADKPTCRVIWAYPATAFLEEAIEFRRERSGIDQGRPLSHIRHYSLIVWLLHKPCEQLKPPMAIISRSKRREIVYSR